jgi:anti-sigma B factor antagonist
MESVRVDVYRPREGAAVVSLRGELGVQIAAEFQRSLQRVIESKPRVVVVDLADVTQLGSRGLAELIALRERVSEHGGTVRIAAPRPDVNRILDAVRLGEALPIFGSVQDALNAKP